MEYDNPQFIAAIKKIVSRMFEQSGQAQSSNVQDDSENEHQRMEPRIVRAELATPVPISIKNEPQDRHPNWQRAKTIAEILGIAAAIYYGYIATRQWKEMISARHQNERAVIAAQRAADTAASALQENKRQFKDTLTEIQKQTKAQKDAAGASLIAAQTAEKQRELMQQQIDMTLRQAAAHLGIQDFTVDIPPGWKGTTTVTFNLVNVGGSAATEIRQDGYSGVYHRLEEAIAATSGKTEPDPIQGFPLDKGEKKPFKVDASGWYDIRNSRTGGDWYDWMRFTYVDIFGRTDSICILMLGGKHGIRRSDCAPPIYPKKK